MDASKASPADRAVFERMSNLHVSMPLSGHELGTLHFMCESFPAVGVALLADMPPDHVDKARVEAMIASANAVRERIDIALDNLQLAATAVLAQEQDNQRNAPSTARDQ